MMFCDQMAAAIDGVRTLTRLDHLSRSIWQGLAAGAVGDDDAKPWPSACTPAEASSGARSSRWASHPADLRSSHPGGCNGLLSVRSRLPGDGTSLRLVRCRRHWPASSRSVSWRSCGLWGMRCVSTATATDAWMSLQLELGSADGWFRMLSKRFCQGSRHAPWP